MTVENDMSEGGLRLGRAMSMHVGPISSEGTGQAEQPRMKQTDTYRVTASELLQFIDRFEHLELIKKATSDEQRDVMAEAKARGYDTKVLRRVIALRKRSADDIAEEEAVLEMYKQAVGLA